MVLKWNNKNDYSISNLLATDNYFSLTFMTNETMIGIDIGTHAIKIIIAETSNAETLPRIIHAIESPSHGFRHGYISDHEKARESFSLAVSKIEREYKQKVTHARFSLGGVGLTSQYVRTSIDNPRKNNEITEQSVEDVVQKAEELFSQKYPNKKILHIIPIKYRVDDKDVLGTPIGMYGNAIEVKVIFITILEHHYDAFITLIEKSNIKIDDIIAGPIADAAVSVSYKKKTQGCMLINIGAETTSFSTFENGIITSLDIRPFGSNNITNDIAIGLQIPLDEASDAKKGKSNSHPKRRVEEIIHARIADILELASRHLAKIKKSRLLPAGIIFTGGGSHIEHVNEYAKQELKLPSEEINITRNSKKTKRNVRVPNQFSIAYGLCISEASYQSPGGFSFSLKGIKKTLSYWLGQVMP